MEAWVVQFWVKAWGNNRGRPGGDAGSVGRRNTLSNRGTGSEDWGIGIQTLRVVAITRVVDLVLLANRCVPSTHSWPKVGKLPTHQLLPGSWILRFLAKFLVTMGKPFYQPDFLSGDIHGEWRTLRRSLEVFDYWFKLNVRLIAILWFWYWLNYSIDWLWVLILIGKLRSGTFN